MEQTEQISRLGFTVAFSEVHGKATHALTFLTSKGIHLLCL